MRKARVTEAPTGDSAGGQPQSATGGRPQTRQEPSTSGAQNGRGGSSISLQSSESEGHLQGPGKRQRLAGGTPEGGQAKRPKQGAQTSYARAAREGIRVAVICENYPGAQISQENFLDIQRAIGRLVDELPEEGSSPSWSTPPGKRGQL
jgi:hypothetical protein